MDAGGEEESYKGGGRFGKVEGGDRGVVDVAEEEVVDGSIDIPLVILCQGVTPASASYGDGEILTYRFQSLAY